MTEVVIGVIAVIVGVAAGTMTALVVTLLRTGRWGRGM